MVMHKLLLQWPEGFVFENFVIKKKEEIERSAKMNGELNEIAVELGLIRKQLELRNKIELVNEALKGGILDVEDIVAYGEWLESSPFIKSLQKREQND